jgi:hypothetical protein
MRNKWALKIVASTAALALGLVLGVTAGSAGGPITKQNGSNPVFADFKSICGVSGYVNYGLCGGDPTNFTNVRGRINAVQAKVGVWNLGLSFSGLTPGASYKLWGNRTGATPSPGVISGFFEIGTGAADVDGTLRYSYQTSDPSNLGFDLNWLESAFDQYGWTIVTSYWSNQTLQVLNANGTLYVPGS